MSDHGMIIVSMFGTLFTITIAMLLHPSIPRPYQYRQKLLTNKLTEIEHNDRLKMLETQRQDKEKTYNLLRAQMWHYFHNLDKDNKDVTDDATYEEFLQKYQTDDYNWLLQQSQGRQRSTPHKYFGLYTNEKNEFIQPNTIRWNSLRLDLNGKNLADSIQTFVASNPQPTLNNFLKSQRGVRYAHLRNNKSLKRYWLQYSENRTQTENRDWATMIIEKE